MVLFCLFFFFFKQKTAYEMRISDWSSDVCSSDLPTAREQNVDVTGYNWRGFYMPGKVTDEQYQTWVGILDNLYQSDASKQEATAKGPTLVWRGGKAFDDIVRQSEAEMRDVSQDTGDLKRADGDRKSVGEGRQ